MLSYIKRDFKLIIVEGIKEYIVFIIFRRVNIIFGKVKEPNKDVLINSTYISLKILEWFF